MTPGGMRDLQPEVERWRDREGTLRGAIRALEEDEARLVEELAKVESQVAYYGALAREMKREIRRPGLSTILRSFRR